MPFANCKSMSLGVGVLTSGQIQNGIMIKHLTSAEKEY